MHVFHYRFTVSSLIDTLKRGITKKALEAPRRAALAISTGGIVGRRFQAVTTPR